MMFLRPGRRQAQRETIERLYGVIVAQARLPSFYMGYAVPDTPEGRFDLLVLHVHLVFRRLAADGPGRETGQQMFDYFIADMDAAVRELGVGDLKVGKKMRGIGEAYYGRANAYDAALKEAGDAGLAAVLLRNIHGGIAGRTVEARRLAHYVKEAAAILSKQDTGAIADGRIVFPDPEKVSL
jgi:cytochrome b pre-mRNA-processing protein 3